MRLFYKILCFFYCFILACSWCGAQTVISKAGFEFLGYTGNGAEQIPTELSNPYKFAFLDAGDISFSNEIGYNTLRIGATQTPIYGTTNVCVGSKDTLNNSISGGRWSSSDTTIARIDSLTGVVTGVLAGLATITYLVSTDTATFSISVNPLPFAGTISGIDSLCQGNSNTLTASVTGGVWTERNNNAFVTDGIVTGITAGFDTIVYTVVNSCGSDSIVFPVKVLPLPIPGTITGGNVCRDSLDTLASTAAGGIWSVSNPRATLISPGVFKGIIAGLDTVYYTVTNFCGVQSAVKILSVDTAVKLFPIIGQGRICKQAFYQFSDSIKGGVWTINNTHSVVINLDSIALVMDSTAGFDTLKYTYTNTCKIVWVKKGLIVDSMPIAPPIVAKDSVCLTGNMLPKDSITIGMGVGAWALTNDNAKFISNYIHGYKVGVDTLLFTLTNSCGSSVATRPVTIEPLPNPGKITGPAIICLGETVTFYDTTADTRGKWNVGTTNPDSTSMYLTAKNLGLINIIFKAKNNCVALSTSYNPEVIMPPSGLITSGKDIICLGNRINLTNYIKGGIWSVTNGNAAVVSDSGIVTGLHTGIDTILYRVTNVCGSDTSFFMDTVVPNPAIPAIQQKHNLLFADTGYVFYQWMLDGQPIAGAVFDTFTINTPGVYEVMVKNQYGCEALSPFKNITSVFPCSINEMEIYPNPASNYIYINWCNYVNACIITLDGRLVLTKNHARMLDISNLPEGGYLLELFDDSNTKIATKLMSKARK